MSQSWTLYDATLGSLTLNEANGILVEEFSPGQPEVRSVVATRPVAHGFTDETRYFGERGISLGGKLIATSSATIGEVGTALKRYLLPNKRPVLIWTRDGVTREIDVRLEKAEQNLMFVVDEFHVEWRAQPFWREPTQQQVPVAYSDSVTLGGDPWPWLGGPSEVIEFEAGTVAIINVDNDGDVDVYPLITVYGQINGVVLRNLTTGLSFEVAANLDDGSSVAIDMLNHTVIIDGLQSAFTAVDFRASAWFPLVPGTNELMLLSPNVPTGATDPYAVVTFHNLIV